MKTLSLPIELIPTLDSGLDKIADGCLRTNGRLFRPRTAILGR